MVITPPSLWDLTIASRPGTLYNRSIMKVPDYLNEGALEALLHQQKRMAFDEFSAISWRRGVDFSKPFLPLDDKNIAFPNISKAEKLVVSQFMGMLIASTISELEITMQRLRDFCWRPFMQRYATNPELINLGEEFFDEEAKHARIFQKFLDLCAKELKLDPEDLKNILPRVNPGYIDTTLRKNFSTGGMALWWIVAGVEEESTLIFRQMKTAQKSLDPLYYELHQRHFEEEARHAPYAFMMIELAQNHTTGFFQKMSQKFDLILSESLKILWLTFELTKSLNVSHLKNHHPYFKTLHGLLPKLKERSWIGLAGSLMTETPYLSTFINPLCHPHLKKTIAKTKAFGLPFPEPQILKVSWS